MGSGGYDVMIIGVESDNEFAQSLADSLSEDGLSVWTSNSSDKSMSVGQLLVASKVLVNILSEGSTSSQQCEDLISLAYISDTPIFPIARDCFPALNCKLSFSMKLILAKLNWMFFISEVDRKENYPVLISSIQRAIAKGHEKPDISEGIDDISDERFVYIIGNEENVEREVVDKPDFWERRFESRSQLAWVDFRDAFADEYKEQLKENFPEHRQKWLMNLIYGDIFELRKMITRKMYTSFCCCIATDPDNFYHRIVDYALGVLAMRSVFDMESTVRLDAVQNLGQFKTRSVISTLINLLNDGDPNMRAVAAIALGKTGVKNYRVVQSMIKKLSDDDRLVREAACISLGHMKAEESVRYIVALWRGDTISHVRQAAEVALGLINSPESQEAIRITQVLSDEMNRLK
ncbi:uncharacterized protein LOC117105240 [Anneissia japonica]|uniref:uncharacterized protein LOC117105240 n=1 Tax=Anneissia japonica TaxID=1529436 RepID=UPI0014255794|nr:uncharacterized protein LOC117105240 [Anneissia japonica]XP_033102215.1 uncharacterized protein LOC117105240 [Anneissia japonica]